MVKCLVKDFEMSLEEVRTLLPNWIGCWSEKRISCPSVHSRPQYLEKLVVPALVLLETSDRSHWRCVSFQVAPEIRASNCVKPGSWEVEGPKSVSLLDESNG